MVIIGNLKFRVSGLESSLHLARCQAWLNQVGRVEKMTMTDPLGDMLTRIRNDWGCDRRFRKGGNSKG